LDLKAAMIKYGLLICAFIGLSVAQVPTEDCPFTTGSCPVTIDNVVDVYFHDVDDLVIIHFKYLRILAHIDKSLMFTIPYKLLTYNKRITRNRMVY